MNGFKFKNLLIHLKWTAFYSLIFAGLLQAQTWNSQLVYPGPGGKLVYVADSAGNRIPDFSYAGYRNGEAPIPDVAVVKTVLPVSGDNTSEIQNALFEMMLMPPDSNGFRGALLLTAGEYEIRGTIKVQVDGIVLRGVGNGADPASNTILKATGNSPNQRTVLLAGGGGTSKWGDAVSGSYRDIVTDTVFVGDRQFEVSDASPYAVGDNIIIEHPCTAAWLAAIDSGGTYWNDPGAEPGVDLPWSIGSQPIVFNRYITDIQENTITIDAPVYNTLVRSIAQSKVYKYARNNLRTQIGIENLRIDIETQGLNTENHAWQAIDMFQLEDAWVRNCTMLHFGQSAVRTNTATRVTVENCNALDPHSEVDGSRRYNFQVYTASQQILFKNCHATNGRHHYVSNGMSWTSGVVFVDCTSSGAFTSSEGHRRWSMGILYDNVVDLDGPRPGYNPRLLGLYCRGYYGTSHGWGLAHSVAWKCDVAAGDLIVQKPPTAQNYAIGCFGARITGHKPPSPFPEPSGYIEGSNTPGLEPRSLYYAQLEDRLGPLGIDDSQKPANVASNFKLWQNYPNPFNPETHIRYRLEKTNRVKLEIFNTIGEKIATLAEERQFAGSYTIVWNGRNQSGQQVASGIYIYRLKVGDHSLQRKMILIR